MWLMFGDNHVSSLATKIFPHDTAGIQWYSPRGTNTVANVRHGPDAEDGDGAALRLTAAARF